MVPKVHTDPKAEAGIAGRRVIKTQGIHQDPEAPYMGQTVVLDRIQKTNLLKRPGNSLDRNSRSSNLIG